MFKLTKEPVWDTPDTEAGSGETAPTNDTSPEPTAAPSAITSAQGEKPGAATPTAEAVEPLTSEALTFPEGTEVPEEAVNEFLKVMNGELPRAELAQKLIDLQINSAQKAAESATEAAQVSWDETQATWDREARALPEIGGERLDASLAQIKKGLIEAGATQSTFEAFDLTGAGNHPEMIRILYALTKPMQEGSPVSGEPVQGKLSQAERMFGGKQE